MHYTAELASDDTIHVPSLMMIGADVQAILSFASTV
jgi:hypothetical protein